MKIVLIVIIAISVGSLFGSVESLPDVSIRELIQDEHPIEADANAAYLYRSVDITFDMKISGMIMVRHHKERIKIYNEQGEDYADFVISLYKDGRKEEKVSNVKGVTYNHVNDNVFESTLREDAVFQEVTSEHIIREKWTMPDVKAGSIIDIEYTISSPWVYTIPRFDFQREIPVDSAEYTLLCPEGYGYTPIITGTLALNHRLYEMEDETSRAPTALRTGMRSTVTTSRRSASISSLSVPSSTNQQVSSSIQPEAFSDIQSTSITVDVVPGASKQYKYSIGDVQAMADDNFVLNIDDYRSSIKWDIEYTTYNGVPSKLYSISWAVIGDNLMKSAEFGRELTRATREHKKLIKSLSGKSISERIETIYYFVQSNYNWNGSYGLTKDVGIKELLKTKTGNVADINLLLINLLLQVKVPVKPCVLKTRNAGILRNDIPLRSELNYVVAQVMTENGPLLLDATSKYVPLGLLPLRATNFMAIVLDEDQADVIEVENPNRSISQAVANYKLSMNNERLVGTGQLKLKSYAAVLHREEESTKVEKEDFDQETDTDEVITSNIINYTHVENLEDISKGIKITYEEEIIKQVKVIEDQVFIDAMIDFGPESNPFYEDQKELPIFYAAPPQVYRMATIEVPKGFKVAHLPEQSVMALEGQRMVFRYDAKVVNNKLVITHEFKVNDTVYLPIEYQGIKQIYDMMIEKSKEKIVLSKI